jgi:hypothetical protein
MGVDEYGVFLPFRSSVRYAHHNVSEVHIGLVQALVHHIESRTGVSWEKGEKRTVE